MSNNKKQKNNQLQRLAAIQAGKKIDLPQNPGDNEEYINILTEFMEQSVEQCKFLEAEASRIKIEQLKGLSNKNKSHDLKDKHLMEQDEIYKAHQEEIQQFKVFWDQKIQEYNEQANQLEQEMVNKQDQEKTQYEEELQDGLPVKFKDSNKLLQMKNQREFLSKQKQFLDAHIVHIELEKLEQEEQEIFDQERQTKIKTLINHLQQKHHQELQALKLKIKKGQEEQLMNKQHEENRLMMKYNVVTKDVKNRQTNENNHLNKTFQNPGMNTSRYLTQSKFNQSRTNIQ